MLYGNPYQAIDLQQQEPAIYFCRCSKKKTEDIFNQLPAKLQPL